MVKIYILRYRTNDYYEEPEVRVVENTEVKIKYTESEAESKWTLYVGNEEPEDFDMNDYIVEWTEYVVENFEYPAVGIYPN